jgi:CHAT domain-containing protein
MRATAMMVLLALPVAAYAADKSEELTPQRRQELEKKADDRNEEAARQYQLGNFVKARQACREVLEIHRRLYPKEKYPQGHPDLANSLNNLAFVYQAAGEDGQAEPLYQEALTMTRALYPKDKYPHGHSDLARSLNNLALLHFYAGEYGRAEPLLKEALVMYRALFPKKQYPQGHADLATSLNNLAMLQQAAGEYGQAEPLLKEALDMTRALFPRDQYPQGHPDLAQSLNNLALMHYYAGEPDKALPLFEEALAMYRTLFPRNKFPRGNPDFARTLSNLGFLHLRAGDYRQAEPLLKEALAMKRALYPMDKYPHGHPTLALSVDNLAGLYHSAGEYDQALPLFQEALVQFRALYPRDRYPQGHPELALSLNNLGALHQSMREYGQAEPLYREASAMSRGLALHYADFFAEATVLNYIASQPVARDGLLSASRHLPQAAVYDALWDSRSSLTRLQERRHRDLMASRDHDTAELAEQLRRARSDLARRLLDPLRDLEQQRATVQKLTEAKEDLEKRIAAKFQLAPQKATSPPAKQLSQVLPKGTVFVDLYRYIDIEQDPEVKGKKGEKRTLRYVAFALLPGKTAIRVELNEAAPIERAWAAWRKAITADRPGARAEREAAARFAELVWQPIREVLPADLTTLYLVPDGPLHQVPWGALPGKTADRVLLDDCAVCLVPHGPFLLERLQAKSAPRAGDSLLVYGGIDYAGEPTAVAQHDDLRAPLLRDKRPRWGDLPGTVREQEQIVALARQVLKAEPRSRSGRQASTWQLEDDLPRVRYAHLATHGFFADPEFRSAIQIDSHQFERVSLDRRGGARSPLVLSGLVMAGANRLGAEAAPDRGIITAEGLIGLRLEGLELAVLSACETALGEYGGGEGVYGLQRAFHVAGCQNVIASLWKVDDGATQALMALFYRNLWEKKLDAAEALRQAQLTLYRHPEAVEVARKRGLDFTESDLPRIAEKPAEKAQHSPTAHWGAFTFSGVRPTQAKPAK